MATAIVGLFAVFLVGLVPLAFAAGLAAILRRF